MKANINRTLSLVTVLALLLVALPSGSGQAVSTTVVISQVYGGGGNSGAQYTNDYVELFNRGTTTISLSGWSVQYTSATGTGNFGSATNLITPLSGSLNPGQYLLVQEAAGATPSASLPTPDVTDSTPIAMSATGGKVALVNTTTPLGCNGGSTPCTAAQLAQIIDLIGYDGANFFEGSAAAPTLSNTTAALRASGGCVDTDDNAADFIAGAPAPRNTSSPSNTCSGGDTAPSVSSTSPANGATGIDLDSNITLTFSEPVDVTGSWFTLSCASSGAHTAAVSGGPVSFTLDPDTDFTSNETCTVAVLAAQVTDQDTDDPPDNMAADYTFSFTTLGPPTFIHDIQGASHISPLNGQLVANVNGIVTALRSNGFYMQDPVPDSDVATSEAIFVFTSSAPSASVGDAVRVAGTIQEFRSGGAAGPNLTITEIGSPGRTVTVLSSGNPLPAPIVIGAGGRVPPSAVIEDDATGDVETSGVFDPANDGIDFYESLEDMLVQVNDAVATSPIRDFGSNREISVVGNNGAHAGVRTPRGGVVIQSGDFNPERIILNDLIAGGPTLPPVDVGDTFPGATLGVIDYNFGNFKLEVTSLPGLASGGLAQEVASPADSDHLAAATFNVENLAATDPQSKFDTLAGLIVHNLRSPDLIAIEEVQDNNGATDNGTVDASLTWGKLIAAIHSAGGPTYDYRQIDPVNDEDGGQPGGNIRQGFLFRADRGLSFVDRPGAGSATANSVTGSGAGTQLQYSPGRIDPTSTAFDDSRKPLAAEFTFNGRHFFAIANHFNSKGGDDPLFGRFQPPTFSSETQRLQQAHIVHDFVQSILSANPNADVIVLGDLNDYQFSSPIRTLTGEISGHLILNDLINTLPLPERYTYVFDGNSEVLDHSLFSNNLFTVPFTYDVVHVNSEYAAQASDHEPQVVQFLSYLFTGFFPPIDNQMSNVVKAGQVVPVKFSINGDKGLNVLAAGYPQSTQIACVTSEPQDPIEETLTAGSSGLSYDPATDTYTYAWKTSKGWANTCRQLTVKLVDGTYHTANFKFTR